MNIPHLLCIAMIIIYIGRSFKSVTLVIANRVTLILSPFVVSHPIYAHLIVSNLLGRGIYIYAAWGISIPSPLTVSDTLLDI